MDKNTSDAVDMGTGYLEKLREKLTPKGRPQVIVTDEQELWDRIFGDSPDVTEAH